MTSSVERKEHDSDDGMYDTLEIYEQCEYILFIINKKNKNKNKNEGTHTRQTKSKMKNKMK